MVHFITFNLINSETDSDDEEEEAMMDVAEENTHSDENTIQLLTVQEIAGVKRLEIVPFHNLGSSNVIYFPVSSDCVAAELSVFEELLSIDPGNVERTLR